MNAEQTLSHLQEIAKYSDKERAHIDADEAIHGLLMRLKLYDIAEEFLRIALFDHVDRHY